MADLLELTIPDELKGNSNLPSPEEIEYWKLAHNRAFFIDYEIDEDYRCVELIKIIIRMNIEESDTSEKDLKPITLYVHSFGGDLNQATALCDIIEASRIPIITVCLGVAMSAGFLIFLAGKRRYALKHSTFLAHEGYAEFSGTSSEIEEGQKNYKKTLDKMREYILSHTTIDKKLFDRNRKKDWYITSKDEIESFGIAKVINSFDEIK